MPAFKVPSTQPDPPVLPAELQPEIDASVKRFEEKWGLMLAYAKANGWLDAYRQEVVAMTMKGYDAGFRSAGRRTDG
jgi:hypothetical protein